MNPITKVVKDGIDWRIWNSKTSQFILITENNRLQIAITLRFQGLGNN